MSNIKIKKLKLMGTTFFKEVGTGQFQNDLIFFNKWFIFSDETYVCSVVIFMRN